MQANDAAAEGLLLRYSPGVDGESCGEKWNRFHLYYLLVANRPIRGSESVRAASLTGRLQNRFWRLEFDGFVVIGIGIVAAFHGHLVRQMIVQADAYRTFLRRDDGPLVGLPCPAADAVDGLLVAPFRDGVADHVVHVRQQIANRASRHVVAIPLGRTPVAGVPGVLPRSIAAMDVSLVAHQQFFLTHLERRIRAGLLVPRMLVDNHPVAVHLP